MENNVKLSKDKYQKPVKLIIPPQGAHVHIFSRLNNEEPPLPDGWSGSLAFRVHFANKYLLLLRGSLLVLHQSNHHQCCKHGGKGDDEIQKEILNETG